MCRFNVVMLALVLAVLLVIGVPNGTAVHGPREEDLTISFYETQEQAYTALTTGEIDLVMYDITSAQADNAFGNPNIITCKVPDSGFYEFDLNNNYTIDAYPGVRSPMNYSEMRKTIAFLSDKDYYVDTLLGTKAVRIDQMIAAPYYGWANTSMSYPNYPYEYNPTAAKAMLDSKFPVGTTPNPYYDPGDPLSSPYLRKYPDDHPQKAGQNLDPLIFYVRAEHNARLQSGRAIYRALRRMGIPCYVSECPSSVSYAPVMGEFSYHFYTGGWSVGRFPPITLYGLYHSLSSFPYGGNYVTGNGTHPRLDELLSSARDATSYSQAVTYCKKAAGYMTEICVNVPLWSVASYWAWSNKLLGVINMQGSTPENEYTFMNARKSDGTPIRCGTINTPMSLNIVYSDWIFDYNVLSRISLFGGVDLPAYNAAADQAGFVDYWDTTTWDDEGTTKTKVVMSFRDNGYFTKPVSGDQGANINASHYFWSAWLYKQTTDSFMSTSFEDLHHIVITGPYDFEIYFNTYSYWNTYYCQSPLLPMDMWMAQGPSFIGHSVETFIDPATPGDITLAHKGIEGPIWIDYVTWNGAPLTMFTDFNIVLGRLHIYTPLGTGTLQVSYRFVPRAVMRGYFPGNLPWQTILEGAGMYYITDYVAGTRATFKRSPYYYMVTPLLGDIDFVKKVNGNYRIDIFDLAMASAAYGSQGTGVPSGNWFPGADLAPNAGVIDIYDIVTVTGTNWNKEYDPFEP
jgi:ABC-type transport system substrate-binding protein